MSKHYFVEKTCMRTILSKEDTACHCFHLVWSLSMQSSWIHLLQLHCSHSLPVSLIRTNAKTAKIGFNPCCIHVTLAFFHVTWGSFTLQWLFLAFKWNVLYFILCLFYVSLAVFAAAFLALVLVFLCLFISLTLLLLFLLLLLQFFSLVYTFPFPVCFK